MIEFVNGINGAGRATEVQQLQITTSFGEGSFAYNVNQAYNNMMHFNDIVYFTDTNAFLHDITAIIKHPKNSIQVSGSIHNNPQHPSNLLLQMQHFNAFFPVNVVDTYIQFRYIQRSPMRLYTITNVSTYHYLIDLPTIVGVYDIKEPVFVSTSMQPLVIDALKNIKFIGSLALDI